MKKIFKFIMAISIASSSLFYSCETTELELIDNPNGLSPDQADPDLLLNTVQIGYILNMSSFNGNAAGLVRINTFGSRDYFSGIPTGALNANWSRTYSTALFPNINAIEALNNEAGDGSLDFHVGISKAMLAHSLMLLVDYIGDIPFSEAVQAVDFPSPNVDPGASVYEAALGLLDEAEGFLTGNDNDGITDLFYEGDSEAWIRMINTVRLKAALTVRDYDTFNSVIAEGNFIENSSQDFEFRFGENEVNPDERHPDYVQDYTPSGASLYRSNWLMNYMDELNDPRIRYYFFRQNGCTPGASCNPDPVGEAIVQLDCSITQPPVHYTNSPLGDFSNIFCFLENGYWGRDHGNNDGIPPDASLRTAVGVYPAGGLLDADNFRTGTIEENPETQAFEFTLDVSDDTVGLMRGGGGAGIEPIFLASYVDFMRAEVALATGDVGAAASFIRSGTEKSIEKVQLFGDLDSDYSPGALLDGTQFDPTTGEVTSAEFASSTLPTSENNEMFVDNILDIFNNGTLEDQWNLLAEQYWVTQYGAGAEAYNFYRRTGFPTTLPPNLELNPGSFVRSFPYPSNEVLANPNISQKADQSVQVFWDTNPPSSFDFTGFPAAN